MIGMNRRSTMALGLSAATAPLFISAAAAATKKYGPTDGKELHPGVRLVEVGEGHSDIPAYKSIKIVDIVYQPGSVFPATVMDNDMVCTITGGELKINKADKEFTLKDGDMYTCAKGKTDMNTNTSKGVVVMRAAILIPA